MTLQFDSKRILREFLSRQHMTVADLAAQAQISYRTADRALAGKTITAAVVRRVAHALGITDATEYLATPRSAMKGSESNEY